MPVMLPLIVRRRLLSIAAAAVLGAIPLSAQEVAVGTAFQIPPAVRALVGGLLRIELPAAHRRHNWTGPKGQGSCVHAAMVHLLHWQQQHELALWWERRYGDGETADGLASKMNAARLTFAETRDGNEAFLEWAVRTRRGAATVVQSGTHMVTLVGFDQAHAFVLDSNSPQRILQKGRGEFVDEWRRAGGWAVTPLGSPPPPSPWIVR
ncbi:MAG: hypothetical protein ACT4QC_17740 [Planctomycetaceae bacterium]